MKGNWPIVLFLAATIGVGCTHRQPFGKGETAASVPDLPFFTDDSTFTDADTLLLDDQVEDAPLPVSIDELFDDFVFVFEQSNHLQRQRIHFPLTIQQANGETHLMQQADWTHRSLFLGQDYCTVLWRNRRQMNLAQDPDVSAASVEQIFLHSRLIEAYDFERDSTSGRWMLTRQRQYPFEHCDLQGFLDFYRQWATDSIYQRQHVQNPMRFVVTDENEEFEAIEGTIDVDQWFEFKPDLPQDVLTNIRYGQSYQNAHRMILQVRGFSNGLQNLLTFQCDATGRWRLTAYEN
ncbi:MAG: DUF4348 domain-containing protein [Bacteroidaceae bacterium]|nr:DUF4348 domain-containing protein [Bacteroidaceae bacterium]